MKSQEGNFTESELAVARYIAGHPMDVVGNTVSKVSELSGLSAAAIVRMCQRMGYSGFSEFRFEMDRQLLSNGTQEEGGANEGGLLSRFVNINAVQLRKVAESVDASLLNHVAASLCAAPRVAVWGVDRMYERALQLSAGLMHAGIFNSVTNDTTVMDDEANILGKGDVCVVISQKGRDYDAYALLMDAIRENGGEVFFVTVNARSQFISHASNAIVLPSIMNGRRSDLADAQLTIYMYLEILLDEVAYLQSKAEGANDETSAHLRGESHAVKTEKGIARPAQRGCRLAHAVDTRVRASRYYVDLHAVIAPPRLGLLYLGWLGHHHGHTPAARKGASDGVKERLGIDERNLVAHLGKRPRAQYDDGSGAFTLGLVDSRLHQGEHLGARESNLRAVTHARDQDLVAGLGRKVALDLACSEAIERPILHELECWRETRLKVGRHVRAGRLPHGDAGNPGA